VIRRREKLWEFTKMANDETVQPTSGVTWQAKQVYGMAVVCLLVGLAIGYLFRGSQSPAPVPQVANVPQQSAPAMGEQMPTLDQMKKMADKKAEPLLEQSKRDPKDANLLVQIGTIYKTTHQFKDAISYYDQALQVDPKNVAARTELASCMYYTGDVDGAISQLQQALHDNPKDANSLFNLGMIKLQGKQDTQGAMAAWKELLHSNPQLSADRKAQVEKLIADLQMQGKAGAAGPHPVNNGNSKE
jgi:cytochrome c-type biogenesis protein CcmH/NrfG